MSEILEPEELQEIQDRLVGMAYRYCTCRWINEHKATYEAAHAAKATTQTEDGGRDTESRGGTELMEAAKAALA